MFKFGAENRTGRGGVSIDLVLLLCGLEEPSVTSRSVRRMASASVEGLTSSKGLCTPAVDVVRLLVCAVVSLRRLLPGFLVLATDFRVWSEKRLADSPGVRPALVKGVE